MSTQGSYAVHCELTCLGSVQAAQPADWPYFPPLASSLDWNNMLLETKINGEVRQSQNTKELIFDIPTLIEVSAGPITEEVTRHSVSLYSRHFRWESR
jgi:hypothetical protein